MASQEKHNRTRTIPVDTFTIRGPPELYRAPLSVTEHRYFNTAYGQFLASIRTLDLTFLNGKTLPVCYSFDETRPEEDRLLINWDCLMPLFWGPPPGRRNFVRLPAILDFVEKKIRFQNCEAVAGDTCSCGKKPNKVVSPERECNNQLHWHHFCTAHVSAWLADSMIPAILLKESKDMFSATIAKLHQNNPDILECYSMRERTDTQVLLDSARNISDLGCGTAASQ